MTIELLKSKIHRVTVTEADLNYVGSITIDETLMEAAHIIENEKVQVLDVWSKPFSPLRSAGSWSSPPDLMVLCQG